jgi:hypothetical protein
MNIKLIAIAIAAFLAGDAVGTVRANRAYRIHLDEDILSNSRTALRWFDIGRTNALNDKAAVAEAFNSMHPAPPAQTQN